MSELSRQRTSAEASVPSAEMSAATVMRAHNVGKCYRIYDQPQDRLKQSLWRGRRKFYQEFWALKDVSFEIQRGETVGIIGSNGSGKSTLLQLICAILSPTLGELQIRGKVSALLELGAGFNPEFSGEENIRVNAAIMGLPQEVIEARMQRIVEFADIGAYIHQPVKFYSSGMYVRLAFATAINVSADILVVDEALAVGDIRFQQKCMAKIKEFCHTGTVVFVSHDTAAVTELCSRVIWIDAGRIRMDGEPKSVVEKYLEHMYGDGSRSRAAMCPEQEPISAQGFDLDEYAPVNELIRQFGNRKATIKAVKMAARGCANGIVHAEQPCDLGMLVHVHHRVVRPIIGYLVKDRMGRMILGDNSDLIEQQPHALQPGEEYLVTFHVEHWPNMVAGEYSLSVAIADGTLEEHDQCHWLHDVIILNNFPVRTPVGLFSPSKTSLELHRINR